MGTSTHGYVSDKVSATDIFNVIVSKFDKDAIFEIHEDRDGMGEIGRIHFKFKEEDRSLFYCLGEVTNERKLEFENGKYAFLSLSYWGESVQIMTEIVKCFGGYLDENDCDDKKEFYISQKENFEYTKYVKERESIIGVLDNHLGMSLKIQVATQILNHKDELIKLFS